MSSPPLIVTDGFLPAQLALQMRGAIDEHFANPQAHRPETHQVWNYWFVPETYTYLRTSPEKVIGQERAAAFHEALRRWSIAMLGMANVSWPNLSLYVPGCRQGWHNDSVNGRFGFVYSLTRDVRRTIGGETLVRREPDSFRSNLTQPQAGRGFYESVEPRFNRLLLFDDRLPHAVERVEGAMDPVEGRFVLHGHISEGGPILEGALPAAAVAGPIGEALRGFREETAAAAGLYHGPLVLRLRIDPTGRVADCAALLDRIIHADPGHADWERVRERLVGRLRSLQFPPAADETVVTLPVGFGKPPASAG
jgi:Rps23 Pro-64 3,4-dihydroxylase Tpa1-like proline 4-hydroxylase